jgi:hypothetical protein
MGRKSWFLETYTDAAIMHAHYEKRQVDSAISIYVDTRAVPSFTLRVGLEVFVFWMLSVGFLNGQGSIFHVLQETYSCRLITLPGHCEVLLLLLLLLLEACQSVRRFGGLTASHIEAMGDDGQTRSAKVEDSNDKEYNIAMQRSNVVSQNFKSSSLWNLALWLSQRV